MSSDPPSPPTSGEDDARAHPAASVIQDALRVSMLSPCRSKRGAVTFLGDTVFTSGCNHQVAPLTCDESDRCKATCRYTAVHAEQAALALVGPHLRGCDLLHVKTVDGVLVPSGQPSCVQCSKLAVLAGIRFVWLYHEAGWKSYDAQTFHELSVRALLVERETRGWQDMENAPQDRTPVILAVRLYHNETVVVGEAVFEPEIREGSWWWANEVEDYHTSPLTDRGQPIAWMPLPAPPAVPPGASHA